jgi:cell division protein FtsQ
MAPKHPSEDELPSSRGPGASDSGPPEEAAWKKWDAGEAERLSDDRGLLDVEAPSPFLRTQKPVPVRRGPLPRKTVRRIKPLVLPLITAVVLVAIAGLGIHYGRASARFRLESSDQILITGTDNVSRDQVLEVFGQDISRNLLAIPLSERKAQLERIPWVESATVMRLLPDSLRVNLRERKPVAVVQLGSRIALADRTGVVMDMPPGAKYSFPVIVGLEEAEPPSKRAASLHIYMSLIEELDSGGANYSQGVDEVDLSDPEDVRIIVTDNEGSVLLHLGSSHFLERYKLYIAHLQEWRQQFHKLDSVDLRYNRQVVLNPDAPGATPSAAPAAAEAAPTAVAKPARAAGRAKRTTP